VGLFIICLLVLGTPTNYPAQAAVTSGNNEETIQVLVLLIAQLQQILAQLQARTDNDDDSVSKPPKHDWLNKGEVEVSGPGYNAMSCANGQDGELPNGALACYGLWDYGDEFGNDVDMCGGYNPASDQKKATGCVVRAPVCESDRAIASKHYMVKGISPTSIRILSENLKTSPEAVRQQLVSVWEYTCTTKSLTTRESVSIDKKRTTQNPRRDRVERNREWSFVERDSQIVVVGVYEGPLSGGRQRGFQEDAEGKVTVDVSSIEENTLLVLSSYEAVNWKLTGSALSNVKAVYVTGYKPSRVSGLPAGVSVSRDFYADDSQGRYFVVHDDNDEDFDSLRSYLLEKTEYSPYLFFGGYSQPLINVSLKG
jgi:hypothetical protein